MVFLEVGALVVGSPDTVIRKLTTTITQLSPGYLILIGSDGNIPHKAVMRSLTLLGQEVLPALHAVALSSKGIEHPVLWRDNVEVQKTPSRQVATLGFGISQYLRATNCYKLRASPKENITMAPWQRITVYRYTLPPPYELETEHLFEELPLSTYPSGTIVEPLEYEMEPGAYLGRAATRTHALVLFPRREPTWGAGASDRGLSFREACDRGSLRLYAPKWLPD